eukprot:403363604
MPMIGLGTFNIGDKHSIVNAVTKAGFRHIDTAYFYQNEHIIGEAIQEVLSNGKIKREDLFIVTKIWPSQYGNPELALKDSLKKLKLDYVDLYLIHWPSSFFDDNHKVPLYVLWSNLEQLVDQGFVKSLGISNFNVQLTADLLTYAKHKPVINQIELHPYNSQTELVRFLLDYNIIPVAHCPLARPSVALDETYDKKYIPDLAQNQKIQEIAQKHGKSELQIILRWHLDRGCGLIPKASSIKHQKENMDINDFKLNKDETEYLNSLNSNYRICNKYETMKGYDMFA